VEAQFAARAWWRDLFLVDIGLRIGGRLLLLLLLLLIWREDGSMS
jgi:hypothetical protein